MGHLPDPGEAEDDHIQEPVQESHRNSRARGTDRIYGKFSQRLQLGDFERPPSRRAVFQLIFDGA